MLITGARNERITSWYELKEVLAIMLEDGNTWRDDLSDTWIRNNQEQKEYIMENAEYLDFDNLKVFISDERDSKTSTWEHMVKQVSEDDEVEELLFSIIDEDFRFYILYHSEKNLFEYDDENFPSHNTSYDEEEVF